MLGQAVCGLILLRPSYQEPNHVIGPLYRGDLITQVCDCVAERNRAFACIMIDRDISKGRNIQGGQGGGRRNGRKRREGGKIKKEGREWGRGKEGEEGERGRSGRKRREGEGATATG